MQTLDRQPTEPEDTTKTIAELNSLRYRGYYYDNDDVGFYYLQSRYYDATTCRFISADEYTDTDTGYLGYNMFAYCNNNPILASDPDGRWLNIVIGAVVGGLVSGISSAIQGKDWDEVLVSAACGAVSGGLAATGLGGVAGQMLVGAATSAIDSGYQNYKEYKSGKITAGEAVFGTLVDTTTGALFGAMGAEGTGAFKESCKITKAGIQGTKTLFAKGLHPATKAVAKAASRELVKYAKKELGHAIVDGCVSTAISWGTNKVATIIYRHYEQYAK